MINFNNNKHCFSFRSQPAPDNDPITFKPVLKDQVNFVDIQNDGLYAATNPSYKSVQFWNNIIAEYEEREAHDHVKDEL